MDARVFLVLIGVALVVGVLLEARRQRKRYGPPSGRAMLRAGMLDLQRHLEPERRVEILVAAPELADDATAGDPPAV